MPVAIDETRRTALTDHEEDDDEDDDIAGKVHEPRPEAAFSVIEAAAEQQREEHRGQHSSGAPRMAADPVREAEVEAGHPQRGGCADGTLTVREQHEAEAELLVEGVDGGEAEGEPDECEPRWVQGGMCVAAVVQNEAKLLGEAKEHEEDKERRKHGPAQAAQAFHAGCQIAPCEVDIPARQAAADQRQRDKQRRDEAEPRVRIHLARGGCMLIPDPMMFDGALQPTTAKN